MSIKFVTCNPIKGCNPASSFNLCITFAQILLRQRRCDTTVPQLGLSLAANFHSTLVLYFCLALGFPLSCPFWLHLFQKILLD